AKAVTTAGGTTIAITIKNHNIKQFDKIKITSSVGISPAPSYVNAHIVESITDANTFVINSATTTASPADASVDVVVMGSSVLRVNSIQPFDPENGNIAIPGVAASQNISILNNDTSQFPLNQITTTQGSYTILVGDKSTSSIGAFSVFACASSSRGGSVTRLASSAGEFGQRIDLTWVGTAPPAIFHSPGTNGGDGAGTVTYNYLVRVFSAL